MVKTGPEDTGVGFGEEESQAAAPSSDDITVFIGQAFNKGFATQSAQVVSHLAAAVVWLGKVRRNEGTQAGIGKPVRQMAELAQAREQSHDTRVAEAKAGSRLAANSGRQGDLVKRGSTDDAVLAHALGVQETSVGLSADGAQVR